MSESRRRISDELSPYVDRADVDGVERTAERLRSARPEPSEELAVRLRERLVGEGAASRRGLSGGRLHATVAGCGLLGLALLGIAELGVNGSGPLGF